MWYYYIRRVKYKAWAFLQRGRVICILLSSYTLTYIYFRLEFDDKFQINAITAIVAVLISCTHQRSRLQPSLHNNHNNNNNNHDHYDY